jgi:hypothetical protein
MSRRRRGCSGTQDRSTVGGNHRDSLNWRQLDIRQLPCAAVEIMGGQPPAAYVREACLSEPVIAGDGRRGRHCLALAAGNPIIDGEAWDLTTTQGGVSRDAIARRRSRSATKPRVKST